MGAYATNMIYGYMNVWMHAYMYILISVRTCVTYACIGILHMYLHMYVTYTCYIYIYIYTHAYMYICMCMYVYIYIYTHTSPSIDVSVYTYMHICIYHMSYTYVCMHMRTCMRFTIALHIARHASLHTHLLHTSAYMFMDCCWSWLFTLRDIDLLYVCAMKHGSFTYIPKHTSSRHLLSISLPKLQRQRVFQVFFVPGAEQLQKLLSAGP